MCTECKKESAVAKKVCVCGAAFPKKSKTVEERMPKCKTNVTEQRKQLETRVNNQIVYLQSITFIDNLY